MAKNEQLSVIGNSAIRIDALEKVTGKAVFCTDIDLPGMLHAKVLRSPHPHAKIVSIDTSKAEQLTGVRCIITGKDVHHPQWGFLIWDQSILAHDIVRCVGDPVAAVAADSEDIAEKAIELIEVKYEQLPAIFDAEESMSTNPRVVVHPELSSYKVGMQFAKLDPDRPNVCNHFKIRKGDVEKSFREADLVMENRFSTVKINHCNAEPPVTIAQPDPDGGLTVWVGKSLLWHTKRDLERIFDIQSDKLRMIQPYVGGSFGGKGATREEPIVVLLSLKSGKTVKHAFTREETFIRMSRVPVIVYIKDGVKNDGTLIARQMKIILTAGGYDDSVSYLTRSCAFGAVGTYRIPNFKLDSYGVYTNLPLSTGFRGVGNPQVEFAIESHMDMLAERLGISPVDIRLRNMLHEGETNVTGEITHSIGAKECLDKVVQHIKLEEKLKNDGVWKKGKGIAVGNKYSAAPAVDIVKVEVKEDGSIIIYHGADEVGQGCNTVMAQIAAEVFGVSVDRIKVIFSDTRFCLFSTGTGASLDTYRTGNSVKMACEDAKRKLFERAALKLGESPNDLESKNGVIYIRGMPHKKVTFNDLCIISEGGEIISTSTFIQDGIIEDREKGQIDPELAAEGKRIHTSWAHTAKAVEIAVNTETGEVKVLKFAAANDMGQPINPKMCEQQAESGMAMSIGDSLYEEMMVKDGVIINPNYTDYRMPSTNEMPTMDNIKVEIASAPHKDGPFGAKGFAEGAMVGTEPAIATAISNAIGIRIKDLPITAEKILQSLKEKA